MKFFEWNKDKNELLKKKRNVSFEDIVLAINNGKLLDKIKNSNEKKYPNQEIFIVDIDSYACLVPFVKDKSKYFLKTIIPSRKATKSYIFKK